eukprot:3275727-Rhodomonas_salina.1
MSEGQAVERLKEMLNKLAMEDRKEALRLLELVVVEERGIGARLGTQLPFPIDGGLRLQGGSSSSFIRNPAAAFCGFPGVGGWSPSGPHSLEKGDVLTPNNSLAASFSSMHTHGASPLHGPQALVGGGQWGLPSQELSWGHDASLAASIGESLEAHLTPQQGNSAWTGLIPELDLALDEHDELSAPPAAQSRFLSFVLPSVAAAGGENTKEAPADALASSLHAHVLTRGGAKGEEG